MNPTSAIEREIEQIEIELANGTYRGRSAMKARLAKLRAQHRKARNGYPRTSDSTWHPGDEM